MRFVRLYARLSTTRPGGMGASSIPVDKIWQWCDRKGIHHEVADYVESVVHAVDYEILAIHEAKMKSERRRGSPPPAPDTEPRERTPRRKR